MQTYGLGTALKIILGYNTQYKRNELVALFNTLNKITISVNTYYNYESKFAGSTDSNGREKKSECPFAFCFEWFDHLGLWSQIWATCGFVFIFFLWVVSQIDQEQKVKKMFKHAFPKEDTKLPKRE